MTFYLCPVPLEAHQTWFPTGAENMGGCVPFIEGFSKFDGGGLSQYMRGAWEELKTMLKNTCEGVHLLLKLQAANLLKRNFFTQIFLMILGRF